MSFGRLIHRSQRYVSGAEPQAERPLYAVLGAPRIGGALVRLEWATMCQTPSAL